MYPTRLIAFLLAAAPVYSTPISSTSQSEEPATLAKRDTFPGVSTWFDSFNFSVILIRDVNGDTGMADEYWLHSSVS